jgi:integrase/recombinase XerC
VALNHLSEFLDSLAAENRSPATIATYRSSLRLFYWMMEKPNPEECSDRTIDLFSFRMARHGHSPNTRRIHLSAVRAYFSFLVSRGFLAESPAAKVGMPKAELRKIETFTTTEVRRLVFGAPMPVPDERIPNPRLREAQFTRQFYAWLRDTAILSCLYYLGLRVSEIPAARLEDYNENTSKLRVKGKGAHRYTALALRDDWLDPMKAFLAFRARLNDYRVPLFPISPRKASNPERGVTAGYVRWLLSSRFRALGLQAKRRRISPHCMRYSLATHCAAAGMTTEQIRVIMRHASSATTERYIAEITMSAAENRKRRALNRHALFRRLGEIEDVVDRLP